MKGLRSWVLDFKGGYRSKLKRTILEKLEEHFKDADQIFKVVKPNLRYRASAFQINRRFSFTVSFKQQ
jgi:hypothetical protein